MSTTLVGILCGVGAAHLVAYYSGHRVVAGILKSLPVLALAALVDAAGGMGRIVALGLVLGAVGDVSLAFPNGFLVGLSAFFLGHLCYVASFAPDVTFTATSAAAALGLGAFGWGMLRYLWPHVRHSDVRIPVVVYVAVISMMAWCAIARAAAPQAGTPQLAAALGAVSFVVSDGVIAVDRFARPFAGAHAIVMVTYYAAQMLIAYGAI